MLEAEVILPIFLGAATTVVIFIVGVLIGWLTAYLFVMVPVWIEDRRRRRVMLHDQPPPFL